MPVGLGRGLGLGGESDLRPGANGPARFVEPRGFHPGAVWIAAVAPVLATLLLVARLAS